MCVVQVVLTVFGTCKTYISTFQGVLGWRHSVRVQFLLKLWTKDSMQFSFIYQAPDLIFIKETWGGLTIPTALSKILPSVCLFSFSIPYFFILQFNNWTQVSLFISVQFPSWERLIDLLNSCNVVKVKKNTDLDVILLSFENSTVVRKWVNNNVTYIMCTNQCTYLASTMHPEHHDLRVCLHTYNCGSVHTFEMRRNMSGLSLEKSVCTVLPYIFMCVCVCAYVYVFV